MNGFNIQQMLLFLPGIIIGLTVHEYAHALTSYKLGDTTAKQAGRLTLNPIKHIDPIGFLFMLIAGFGWAKPVQFNPENLKHKKRDEILISLAGPFSNLIMGIVFFVVARVLFELSYFNMTQKGFDIINFLILSGSLNFGLFVFNMIPLPPLDGSHLYLTFLEKKNPVLMKNLYRYGSTILLVVIILQNNIGVDILPIGKAVRVLSDFMIKVLAF